MNPKFQFSMRTLILVVLAIGVPFACFRMVTQMRVDAALYRRAGRGISPDGLAVRMVGYEFR